MPLPPPPANVVHASCASCCPPTHPRHPRHPWAGGPGPLHGHRGGAATRPVRHPVRRGGRGGQAEQPGSGQWGGGGYIHDYPSSEGVARLGRWAALGNRNRVCGKALRDSGHCAMGAWRGPCRLGTGHSKPTNNRVSKLPGEASRPDPRDEHISPLPASLPDSSSSHPHAYRSRPTRAPSASPPPPAAPPPGSAPAWSWRPSTRSPGSSKSSRSRRSSKSSSRRRRGRGHKGRRQRQDKKGMRRWRGRWRAAWRWRR